MRPEECETLIRLLDRYGQEHGRRSECEFLANEVQDMVNWLRLPVARVVGPQEQRYPMLNFVDREHPPLPYRVRLTSPDGTHRDWADGDGWPHSFATREEAEAKLAYRVQTGQWRHA